MFKLFKMKICAVFLALGSTGIVMGQTPSAGPDFTIDAETDEIVEVTTDGYRLTFGARERTPQIVEITVSPDQPTSLAALDQKRRVAPFSSPVRYDVVMTEGGSGGPHYRLTAVGVDALGHYVVMQADQQRELGRPAFTYAWAAMASYTIIAE